mmetsp:Transcript_31116/g.61371  ORF Transcript_31116/g.61371 Transcript_31116/m.61371 type:complete len:84 (-) Transcript_31116:367-618(-)
MPPPLSQEDKQGLGGRALEEFRQGWDLLTSCCFCSGWKVFQELAETFEENAAETGPSLLQKLSQTGTWHIWLQHFSLELVVRR